MLETQFWNLLKEHLPGDVSRIENSVDSGTPDVSGAYSSAIKKACIDYWIELKVCRNKAKLKDPTDLCLDSQLIWHFRRGKLGSLIYVMVRYPTFIMVYIWNGAYSMYRPIYRVEKSGRGLDWPMFENWFVNHLYTEIERRKKWST